MKKKVVIVVLIFSLGLLIGLTPTQATSGPYQWAMTYDTSVGERDHAYAVKQTPDGGFIVAGGTDSFPYHDFDYSMWIIKLEPDGSVAWQKSLEGGLARTIELTHDGGYIVAGSYYRYREPEWPDEREYWSDMWVIKLDADGNVIWQKTYGGDYNESVHSIIQSFDSEGNFEGYVAAGSTAECYPECNDFCIVKLDPDGNVLLQKKYAFEAWEGIRAIQQTQDGGYMVAGSNQREDFDGCGKWHGDVCVMKLESDLDVVWQYNYGGCNSDDAASMVLTADGGCIVAGNTNSFGEGVDADFWVLKLAADGGIVWEKRYGGDADDYAKSVKETRDGGYIVAGYGGRDMALVKLDPDGNILWQKTYGGSERDNAYAVEQTEDGEYIVAGDTHSFGETFDYFVLKVDAMGEIPNCGIIGTGAFSVSDTLVVPEESAAVISDTVFVPARTAAVPEENDFETLSICAGCFLCEDQINDVDTGTSVGCGGPGSLFQSFTPSVSSLAAVDLRLRAGGSFPDTEYETTINIREATTDGAVLATATTLVPGPQTTGAQIDVRFNFSPEIVLTPGNVYVIEWIETDNDTILTWMRAEGDTYTDGNAFGCGGMNPIVDKDFIFTTFYCCTPNTPSGFNIFVQLDPAVSVRYPRVDLAGMTALKELLEGPPPEPPYYIVTPPTFYDVTTTAVVTGLIEITVDYSGINFTHEEALGLFHYENSWEDITSVLDTNVKKISGMTDSLSLFTIFEKDVQAPELHVSVSPETLWPPNHKMVHIETAITVTDDHDPDPTFELKAITMDKGDGTNTYDPQYDNTPGDGNTTNDIQVDEDGNIYLRAERSGKGDGRVYTITFTATDASGNKVDASAEVTVPHNQ